MYSVFLRSDSLYHVPCKKDAKVHVLLGKVRQHLEVKLSNIFKSTALVHHPHASQSLVIPRVHHFSALAFAPLHQNTTATEGKSSASALSSFQGHQQPSPRRVLAVYDQSQLQLPSLQINIIIILINSKL